MQRMILEGGVLRRQNPLQLEPGSRSSFQVGPCVTSDALRTCQPRRGSAAEITTDQAAARAAARASLCS